MVEENFENWYSKRLQIDLIVLLSDDYFTMVEENYGNWHSKRLYWAVD